MLYTHMCYPDGKRKAVTLSYDDGVRQDIRFARILDRYGIKCTFNLNSCRLTEERKDKNLTEQEIREYLLKQGHEIAVHGKFHKAAGLCRPTELVCDVLDCRREMEAMFGFIIRGMAYPDSGITNLQANMEYPAIRQILKDCGIVYARTLGGDNDSFRLPTDWYAWMPTAHHTNPNTIAYAEKFVNLDIANMYEAAQWPRLFYLWGHAYEFDREPNWDYLERLCGILGNREDIWYATNMEIYNYVNAYRQLEYSADGSMVYNPTLVKVWFARLNRIYSVAPGETIRIEE